MQIQFRTDLKNLISALNTSVVRAEFSGQNVEFLKVPNSNKFQIQSADKKLYGDIVCEKRQAEYAYDFFYLNILKSTNFTVEYLTVLFIAFIRALGYNNVYCELSTDCWMAR